MSLKDEEKLTALLRSKEAPSESQRARLLDFLKRTYETEDAELRWEKDDSLRGGFRLIAGTDIYDWSREGFLRKFKDYLRELRLGDG